MFCRNGQAAFRAALESWRASGILALAVEAEYTYCADAVGPFTGFSTLLKSVQYHAETQIHVVKARAGRPPPAYVGYEACTS